MLDKDKKEENISEAEELKKKSEEYLDGWKRERASFINYKKEEMERISGIIKYAGEEFVLKILPVLDNFDAAEKNIPANLKEDASVKGLLQIKQQIKDFLKSQGVEEIKTEGEKFDPNLMEAVGEVSGGQTLANSETVAEETQKGYTMNGKIIRPAKVKVTK
jgi:molecular chaperone GrpE